jgi:hypothetical protein
MDMPKNRVGDSMTSCQLPDTVSAYALAADALDSLAAALATLERFKAAGWTQLDPWQAESFLVAEQAVRRAHLAFSQLRTDLLASAPHGP